MIGTVRCSAKTRLASSSVIPALVCEALQCKSLFFVLSAAVDPLQSVTTFMKPLPRSVTSAAVARSCSVCIRADTYWSLKGKC